MSSVFFVPKLNHLYKTDFVMLVAFSLQAWNFLFIYYLFIYLFIYLYSEIHYINTQEVHSEIGAFQSTHLVT